MLLYNLQLQSYTRDIKKGYRKAERIFGYFSINDSTRDYKSNFAFTETGRLFVDSLDRDGNHLDLPLIKYIQDNYGIQFKFSDRETPSPSNYKTYITKQENFDKLKTCFLIQGIISDRR